MPSPPVPAVRVTVPAKINLHLSVGPVRADGFHELYTVFHAVDLVDDVVVAAAPSLRLTVTGERAGVPGDERNIVWQAASAMAARAGRAPGVRMRLGKRIPVAGGMAGGSADAAGTLLALRRLWALELPDAVLAELAAGLGSDVAFGLVGGTAVGTGRGEVLTPVTCPALHWVLAPGGVGIFAGAAYAELDRLRGSRDLPAAGDPGALLAALAAGDLDAIAGLLVNDLQAAAISLQPALAATLEAGVTAGALAGIVSGSGPTCAFLCRDASHAADVAARLGAGTIVARGPASPTVCA